ncbi:MAG: patatin family protein [Deltaproteobacteria bacterium]
MRWMSEGVGRSGTALVVEGGGMRGVFTAGVLDVFAEKGVGPFGLYIGVSAGALTLSSYLSGQAGRNLTILTGAGMSPQFMSFRRFLLGGHWIDMDWAFETWERERPTDIAAALAHLAGRQFLAVCTSVATGQAVYLEPRAENWIDCLRATSALPVYYRGFIDIGGQELADGSMAAPLPVAEAIARGARRIIVLRTRPSDFRARLGTMERYVAFKVRGRRALQQAGYRHPSVYNASVELIAHPPEGVDVLEIAPPVPLRTGRTHPTEDSLKQDYESGRAAALAGLVRMAALGVAVSG